MATETSRERLWRLRYRVRRVRAILGQALASAFGALRHDRVRAYWWNRLLNFGDLLTPELLARGGRVAVWSSSESAQLVGAGSVLQWLSPAFRGVVFGSGLIAGEQARRLPEADIVAVRGRLTAEAMGLSGKIRVGDPGLLAHRLVPDRSESDRLLGLVPHYVDRADGAVLAIAKEEPEAVRVIDVQQSARRVARAIGRCEVVVSSSLHGLVVADALGRPSVWARFSGELVGGRFKFDDYYSALDTRREPVGITGAEGIEELRSMAVPPSERVSSVIAELDAAWSGVLARLTTY